MKVFELIEALLKIPAGKDVSVVCNEKCFVPLGVAVHGADDLSVPMVIFVAKDD